MDILEELKIYQDQLAIVETAQRIARLYGHDYILDGLTDSIKRNISEITNIAEVDFTESIDQLNKLTIKGDE